MRRSYLDYAMSVIVGRALPDIRDGLKPVHRRILFGMHEMGLAPNRPTTQVRQDHRRGDGQVPPARRSRHLRFAWSAWRSRSPCAIRWWKGRATSAPSTAIRPRPCGTPRRAFRASPPRCWRTSTRKPSISAPTTTTAKQEPEVLPTRVPNLLVNGSSGIAVGMATNIPPHNLTEIINATIHLIQNPDAPLAKILEMVPGPDFPTGGFILGRQGILDAYTTRPRPAQDARQAPPSRRCGKDREQIVVTEIPYQVNKSQLIEQASALVNEKKHRRHLRHPRRKRPRRHAHRVRTEARRAGRSGPQQPLQAHAACRPASASSCCPSSTASRANWAWSTASSTSSTTAWKWSAGAPNTNCARRASASTCCSASRRRSTTWTK